MSKLYEALKMAEAEVARERGQKKAERSSVALPNSRDSEGEKTRLGSEGEEGLGPQYATRPLQGHQARDGARRVSIMPRGMALRGDIRLEENLIVQGHVEGSISLTGELVIEAGAVVWAELSAARIIVGGSVKGNLAALERVEVLPTGKVTGDIRAKMLLVHDGASIVGGLQAGAPEGGGLGELKEVLTQFQQFTSRLVGIVKTIPSKEAS